MRDWTILVELAVGSCEESQGDKEKAAAAAS